MPTQSPLTRLPSAGLAVLLGAFACFAQTGTPVPAFSALDDVMEISLSTFSAKGGALAVLKDGHLVFARGYGLADAEAGTPVAPDSLFRWGSVSKTITAAAVMHLVEDGKLDLDTPVWSILNQYAPYNGKWGDSRLSAITVRQVLHHTGGWDRDKSGDPLVGDRTVTASNATHTSFPPTRDTVIRYMLSQRLDFDPGSRFAYSNFGYMLLGRVIEKVSGQPYETYVRQNVLNPAGIPRVQQGGSTLALRLPGEVKYYDYPRAPLISSYVSPAREKEPRPYGALSFDLNDADGAWVGSVLDLAKFVAMLDGARPRALVSGQSFASMVAETPPSITNLAEWYGFGLFLVNQLGGVTWSHGGANYGTRSYFWRFANGIGYAFVFNGDSQDQTSLTNYAGQAIWDALAAVTDWPDQDLFPQYYPPRIAESGVVNAASFQPGPLAPGSLGTVFGVDLGGQGADVSASLRDASGAERTVPLLYSGAGQLNGVLPDEAVLGDATLIVHREGWPDAEAPVPIAAVSPGVFQLNAAGLAAASLVRAKPGQTPSWESVYQVDGDGNVTALPIAFADEDEELWLVLYATGVRGCTAPEQVTMQVGDFSLLAAYAGPQMQYQGLDQINVKLPRGLAGAGVVNVKVEVDGNASNVVSLTFR